MAAQGAMPQTVDRPNFLTSTWARRSSHEREGEQDDHSAERAPQALRVHYRIRPSLRSCELDRAADRGLARRRPR